MTDHLAEIGQTWFLRTEDGEKTHCILGHSVLSHFKEQKIMRNLMTAANVTTPLERRFRFQLIMTQAWVIPLLRTRNSVILFIF